MLKWFRARWQAYLDTSDPDAALAGSSPGATATAVLVVAAVVLPLQYVPSLQEKSGMRFALVSVGLACVGAAFTHTAYRTRCRGTLGSIATLFDNTFYSAALALAAMHLEGNYALAVAAVHGLSMLLFPGQSYALTLLLAIVMIAPLVILIILLQPALPVILITCCSVVGMLMVSAFTKNRRELARRQHELDLALQAANTVADESVQAALTTTLLTLGHFLHELRNYQTSISSNLEYVQLNASLRPAVLDALVEARLAQTRQEDLVRSTVDDLRARSSPSAGPFRLSGALERAAKSTAELRIEIAPASFDVEISGNPEHLGVVLLNLFRNSEQAGARVVRVACQAEASGNAVQLAVHDDGPGLKETDRAQLFDTFALSTKASGSGLGLYLVRRYVELLGGRVTTENSEIGGAGFRIRLPGRVVATRSMSPGD